MHGATFIAADGTFKYCPLEFKDNGQIYTIHTEINGESVVLATILFRAERTRRAYEQAFTIIRNNMIAAGQRTIATTSTLCCVDG